MENLEFYNEFRAVPKEAQKTIAGGKLKGFTDINPMWRIKALSAKFGPCGFGWYISDIERWVEKNGDNEAAVFVKLNLYVKWDNEWSKPIAGIGGSKLNTYVNGKNGQGGYYDLNDEAFKMAYTDAISIACKALGMAADIYYDKDAQTTDNRTKYDVPTEHRTYQRRPANADPASYGMPVQKPAYQPMDVDRYWSCVEAEAMGQRSKTGRSIKETWMSITHADADAIIRFDYDVDNYKVAHGIL